MNRTITVLLGLLLVQLAAGVALAQPEKIQPEARPAAVQTSLAIWRLKPLGMDDITAQRLEGLLRSEAAKIAGVSLQDRDETKRKLAGQEALLACGGETACLCKIGQALGVGKLSTGVIGALGDDYTFDLKLIDSATCREERRINEALSGREDLLIGAIRQALYKLVAPALYVGSLSVDVPLAGARVQVDGQDVGSTPLARAIANLKPGIHRLRIFSKGYSEFQEEVPVRFQQTTRVKVDMVKSVLTGLSYEKEEQPDPKPVVQAPPQAVQPAEPKTSGMAIGAWTTAGLALASAAVAGILGWRSLVAEQELEEAASASRPYLNADHRAIYDQGQKFALGANVAWGVAGAAALTSATLFIVELVSDEPNPKPEASGTTGLTLAPAVTPHGGGLSIGGRF